MGVGGRNPGFRRHREESDNQAASLTGFFRSDHPVSVGNCPGTQCGRTCAFEEVALGPIGLAFMMIRSDEFYGLQANIANVSMKRVEAGQSCTIFSHHSSLS